MGMFQLTDLGWFSPGLPIDFSYAICGLRASMVYFNIQWLPVKSMLAQLTMNAQLPYTPYLFIDLFHFKLTDEPKLIKIFSQPDTLGCLAPFLGECGIILPKKPSNWALLDSTGSQHVMMWQRREGGGRLQLGWQGFFRNAPLTISRGGSFLKKL